MSIPRESLFQHPASRGDGWTADQQGGIYGEQGSEAAGIAITASRADDRQGEEEKN